MFNVFGLGIGDWGLGPIPNPQSPIPNKKYNNKPKTIINYYKLIDYTLNKFINALFNPIHTSTFSILVLIYPWSFFLLAPCLLFKFNIYVFYQYFSVALFLLSPLLLFWLQALLELL